MTMRFQISDMSDFISWWCEGLMAWLPPSLQLKIQQKAVIQCVLVDEQLTISLLDKLGAEHDRLVISLRDDKQALETWLTSHPNHEIILYVQHADCLIKRITLPEKAKDKLDSMLAYEVERHTPFSYDNVHVGYRVNEEVDAADHLLLLTLVVVPRNYVNKIVSQLAEFNVSINSLLIRETATNIVTIPVAEVVSSSRMTTRLNYGLLIFAFVLLCCVLYKPAIHYNNAIETLEQPLTDVKKQAKHIMALKQTNKALSERGHFIETQLLNYRSRLVILNELATLLPKHTWLQLSEIRNDVLTIRGESSSASDLVNVLTDSDYFSSVRFNAPTTQNTVTGKERFSIEAKIKTAGSKKDED